MIIRLMNKNTGKLIAYDTKTKKYEWLNSYYDGKILNEKSMIMTTTIYVINNEQLRKMEKELVESGYRKL